MRPFIILCACLLAGSLLAQNNTYKRPPAHIAAIQEAPPTPFVSVSPMKDALALVQYNPNPGIELLSRPFLKLGGLRLDAQHNSRQRITEFRSISIQWVNPARTVVVQIPKVGQLAGMPRWSPNGKWIAFPVEMANGVALWTADTRTGASKNLGNFFINDVLGTAFDWMEDSERLWVRLVPTGRKPAPKSASVPTGPAVEETAGKFSQVMTYQDLLRNDLDERQFEYYATSQPALVQRATGKVQPMGKPDLYASLDWSPDEQYLLLNTIQRPFSYRVPFNNFARTVSVWNKMGKEVYTVATFPVTDEIPRQGVITGPRSVRWQALHPARLMWVEALDGGDPKRKVDFRDKLLRLDAPFTTSVTEVLKMQHRFSGADWTADKDVVLLNEYDRDRRWATTWRVDLAANPIKKDTLFDLSTNDDYKDPGNPVYELRPNGDYVMAQEGDWAYFSARGASPQGAYPRLDKVNLKTRARQTLFQSAPNTYEAFQAFIGNDKTRFLTRYESKKDVPNFVLRTVGSASKQVLTHFTDPAPQMTGVEKSLIQYKRADGVPLSGTLYLPPNRKPGEKLPLFIWAYPLEYSDASTAGQVRGSDNTFTFYRNDSPLFFVTQGYAVLMDATMPVVGDPETMNNTFIEQITGSGRAAINYLDSLGLIDRKRVGVGGHSYGAFMTANLLAHSDDYAYGIARSGAYNRTLTPFGFQSERRSFWEAQDIYLKVSPFTYAHKINEPILLVHGEADNNPGTHTMQSERLFQAIKGNGGTARLVLLPHESHGYRARESVGHVVAEMLEWAEKYGHGSQKTTP